MLCKSIQIHKNDNHSCGFELQCICFQNNPQNLARQIFWGIVSEGNIPHLMTHLNAKLIYNLRHPPKYMTVTHESMRDSSKSMTVRHMNL